MRSVVKTAQGVQDRLDKMIRGSGIEDGSKAYGGIQPIAAGELIFDRSIRLSSKQTIRGQKGETRIIWKGGPDDPPLFNLWAYTGHGYIDMPCIEDLIVDCVNGGRMIGLDPTVKYVESLAVTRVVTRGGAIVLPGENYGCTFDNVRMIASGRRMLDIAGQVTTFRGCKLQGSIGDGKQIAMTVRGSSRWEGFSWLQGYFAGPTLGLYDWNGVHGEHEIDATWEEANIEGTFAIVHNATAMCNMIGGTERWPWVLEQGGQIRTQRPPHSPSTVISPDATGRLFVNGAQQQVMEK